MVLSVEPHPAAAQPKKPEKKSKKKMDRTAGLGQAPGPTHAHAGGRACGCMQAGALPSPGAWCAAQAHAARVGARGLDPGEGDLVPGRFPNVSRCFPVVSRGPRDFYVILIVRSPDWMAEIDPTCLGLI